MKMRRDARGRVARWTIAAVAAVLIGVGWIWCRASCQVLADHVPPAVTSDVSGRPISGSNIQLTWTAHGDNGDAGRASAYEIRYALTPITDEVSFRAARLADRIVHPEKPLTTQSFAVQHLMPDTTYYLALKTGDKEGNWSGMSNVVTVTTLSKAADVSELFLEEATSDELTVSWLSPGPAFMDEDASGTYDLRFSKAPITTDEDFNNATVVPDLPVPAETGVRQQMTVDGLAPATSYYFAFHMRDDQKNVLELSAPKLFTTVEEGEIPAIYGSAGRLGNGMVHILPDRCTSNLNVQLILHAEHTKRYRVSNLESFTDAPWENYPSLTDDVISRDWALTPGDGSKTVYVQFEGREGDVSNAMIDRVRLDTTNHCHSAVELAHKEADASDVEVDQECLTDRSHATVEPYLVLANGTAIGWRDAHVRVSGISLVETQYSFAIGNATTFDDVVVHVARVGDTVELHIVKVKGKPNIEVRYRVDAADRKRLDDRSLWRPGSGSKIPTEVEEDVSLAEYPEICPSVLVPHPHPGDLFSGIASETYVLGSDFKRHPFPDAWVLASWYPQGASSITVADYQLASYPLGDPVTYRPGVGVYELDGQPGFLYAVDTGPSLRRVADQAQAVDVFGVDGRLHVGLISSDEALDYKVGPLVSTHAELLALHGRAATATIDRWGNPRANRYSGLTHSIDVTDGRVQLLDLPYQTTDPKVRFRILGKNGTPLTARDLTVGHGNPAHLLVVRDDLSAFVFVHPDEQGGVWSGDVHVVSEGFYYAFVDVVPSHDAALVLRTPLVLGAHPETGKELPPPNPDRKAQSGPYTVVLQAKKWEAGKELTVEALIEKDGKPFWAVERSEDGYGQFVYFKQHDTATYLHTDALNKPEPGMRAVPFRVWFPTSGRYTSFVTFQLDGEERTFPITFDIP